MRLPISSSKSGVALLIAMFFEVLLYLLAVALLQLVPMELTAARRDHVKSESYYYSNAMEQSVLAWLCYMEDTNGEPLQGLSGDDTGDVSWPKRYLLSSSALAGFDSHLLDSHGSDDLTWTSILYLYPDGPTLGGGSPHTFKLRVLTRLEGNAVGSYEYVLQQMTFAKYGFFVDKLPNNGYYTAMRDDRYEGEFHVNGKLPLYVDSKLFSQFVAPVFRGKLTFTQAYTSNPFDAIAYQSGSSKPFDASGNTIVDSDGLDRYAKLCSQGRAAIQLESDVPMPETDVNSELPYAKAAWFGRNSKVDSLASAPIASGVNLNRLSDGSLCGVYVRGDMRELNLDVQDATGQSVTRDAEGHISTGNPVARFQEESNAQAGQALYTRVVELRDSNVNFTIPSNAKVSLQGGPASLNPSPLPVACNQTVVIRDPGTSGNPGPEVLYEVLNGFPNGVIYVDGNIGKVPALDAERQGGSQVNRDYLHSDSSSQGGLKGTNYGAPRTIGVNLAHNNYIRLAGDLLRGDARPGEAPLGRRDGMGIVGYDVIVASEIPRSGDTQPFYLYSLLFAGRRDLSGQTQSGSMIYENWDTRPGWGRLFSCGSYVVGQDRIWGDNGSHGWMPTFRHDATLANSPPPFYPTRSDYKMQSYQQIQKLDSGL